MVPQASTKKGSFRVSLQGCFPLTLPTLPLTPTIAFKLTSSHHVKNTISCEAIDRIALALVSLFGALEMHFNKKERK